MKNSICETFIILIMLYSISSYSQQVANRVNYNKIAISFVIPAGWTGQETQAGYMLKSNTMAGFVLINKNYTSDINTMLTDAKQGFFNDNLNYLQLIGNVENFNSTGVGATYQGLMEGVSAKGYMVGVLDTMGLGVSIMAVTTSKHYSSAYRQMCIDIASSVAQIQSEVGVNKLNQNQQRSTKNETEELFAGARLTYYDTGDGYSTKITIDLCEQGFFYHSSYDSMSADVGDVSVGYGDDSKGVGKWFVIEKANQNPILQLKFKNGKIYEYYITFDGKKTYLDGYRYFRVYGEEGARWCY